jgi:hypothetical protein
MESLALGQLAHLGRHLIRLAQRGRLPRQDAIRERSV